MKYDILILIEMDLV